MRRVFCLLLVALILTAAPARSAPSDKSRPLALTHVTVVDVAGGATKRDMTVVVRGGRIAAVGRTGGVRVPRGARVIVATGKFLIPGLWDMHVHVNETGGWFFPLALANGVTGVRDMGSAVEQPARWRAMRRRGALMPRVVASGPIVTGPVKDDDPRLIRVADRAEGVRAVDTLFSRGADFIKVHDWLSRDAYEGVIAQARVRGVPVVGHLPVLIDAAEASEAGQRSIEHMGNAFGGFLLDCSTEERALKEESRSRVKYPVEVSSMFKLFGDATLRRIVDGYSPAKADALAAVFLRNGTWLTPTIYSFSWLTTTPIGESFARDPRLKYLPAGIRSTIGDLIEEYASRRLTPEQVELRRRLYERHLEFVRAMHGRGVPLLAGTDYAEYPLLFPGFSLHDELAKLVEAGLTPLEALQTATINPAKFLHAEDSLGTVAEGKLADLVLLDADPLESIGNTRRIDSVFVNGNYLPKETLRKMLADVEAASKRQVP